MTTFKITDPDGFPSTIVQDFERADKGQYLGNCSLEYDNSTRVISGGFTSGAAGKALYDWLEETAQYYRTEYVDASGEYRAAKQLASTVYSLLKDGEVA